MNIRDLERAVARLIDPLSRRVMTLAARGVLIAAEDREPVQGGKVQLRESEVLDKVEVLQPFGLGAVAPGGLRCLLISFGGSRDHSVVVVVDGRKYQPVDLAVGEAVLFNAFGHCLYLPENGEAVLKVAKLRIEGDLEVTGEVKDRCDTDGKTMEEMRNLYDGHTHPAPGGNTGAPSPEM